MGYYGGNSCDGKFWTMVDSVQQYVSNTVTLQGVPSVTSNDMSGIADAVSMAKDADAVILAIGTDLTVGREGHDADTIMLSEGRQALVDQVAGNATGPVIVVTFTHNPFDLSSILKNDKISAVMHIGQPSVQVIGAGDVLFGKRTPAGRMVATVYEASYADDISIFDFNMRPGSSVWPRPDCPKPYDSCKNGTNPGRTHRFYTGDAVVPFGYGLSYTTWKYEVTEAPQSVTLGELSTQLQASAEYVPMKQPVEPFKVKVTNTGSVDLMMSCLHLLLLQVQARMDFHCRTLWVSRGCTSRQASPRLSQSNLSCQCFRKLMLMAKDTLLLVTTTFGLA